jgi:NAD(P)-dependent dehydrogenase (short-subunit alcohol dehydrogenase family)
LGIFGSSKKRSNEALAVITGAGSGIGAAFATELARRGGSVVCSDIDETAARTTADDIGAAGGKALATRCDVAKLEDVIQLAKVSQDWLGRPPTEVVNNAGVGAGGSAIGETEIDDWNWVLGINCGARFTVAMSSRRSFVRPEMAASSTSRPPRHSVRRRGWRPTT